MCRIKRSLLLILLGILLLYFQVLTNVSCSDIYVNNEFTGTSNGDESTPWKSITSALSDADEADTIHINYSESHNPYDESITISHSWITLQKWGENDPYEIDGSVIFNAKDITVNDCTLVTDSNNNWRVKATAEISDAIDASSDDDTILVRAGIYHEDVTINKNVLIEGNDPLTTYIHGDVTISSGQSDVEIKRFSIIGGEIFFDDDSSTSETDIKVTGCFIYEEGYGIRFYDVQNVTITNCAIFNNINGIDLQNCDYVSINSCRIFDNDYEGIIFEDVNGNETNYCEIKDTLVFSNGNDGIEICDINSVESNYIKIFHSHIFQNDGYGIKISEGTNFSIEECTIYDNSMTEIYCDDLVNITIEDCSIAEAMTGSGNGIRINECLNVTIDDCNIAGIDGTGIYLSEVYSSGSENTIENCNIMNVNGTGIKLIDTDEIYIEYCNILEASEHGIEIINALDSSYYYELNIV